MQLILSPAWDGPLSALPTTLCRTGCRFSRNSQSELLNKSDQWAIDYRETDRIHVHFDYYLFSEPTFERELPPRTMNAALITDILSFQNVVGAIDRNSEKENSHDGSLLLFYN